MLPIRENSDVFNTQDEIDWYSPQKSKYLLFITAEMASLILYLSRMGSLRCFENKSDKQSYSAFNIKDFEADILHSQMGLDKTRQIRRIYIPRQRVI